MVKWLQEFEILQQVIKCLKIFSKKERKKNKKKINLFDK